jgi:hypothetical protein
MIFPIFDGGSRYRHCASSTNESSIHGLRGVPEWANKLIYRPDRRVKGKNGSFAHFAFLKR